MNVKDLVYSTYNKLRDEFNLGDIELDDTSVVFGAGGITSLQLVRLIVELEDQIIDQTGKYVNFTDDRVLSLKHSPFANLGAFVSFVQQKIEES